MPIHAWCSVMPLHNAAMLFELWRAHFRPVRALCPLIALNQEHQLATISPKRQWTHSLWAIWHQRHTVAICLIIPLVNNGRVWDWTLEKCLSPEQRVYKLKQSSNEGKPLRVIINQDIRDERESLDSPPETFTYLWGRWQIILNHNQTIRGQDILFVLAFEAHTTYTRDFISDCMHRIRAIKIYMSIQMQV